MPRRDNEIRELLPSKYKHASCHATNLHGLIVWLSARGCRCNMFVICNVDEPEQALQTQRTNAKLKAECWKRFPQANHSKQWNGPNMAIKWRSRKDNEQDTLVARHSDNTTATRSRFSTASKQYMRPRRLELLLRVRLATHSFPLWSHGSNLPYYD